ncbi:DUF982 domain-containing protein [Pseudomonas sp. R2.Fl]|nr:DUF982 domain-containing protein [Pseudomonas sp. R2.Fl]
MNDVLRVGGHEAEEDQALVRDRRQPPAGLLCRNLDRLEWRARALLNRWPVAEGKRYFDAQRIILAVMEGKDHPEKAREAFLSAAVEAGVFVREQ